MGNANPFGSIDVLPGVAAEAVAAYRFADFADVGKKRASRGWESADTNRLNESHWADASVDILQSLKTDLPELQRRARHEAINNGLIDGAIETQTTNTVSARGPALQVTTGDDVFNADVEALFAAWAEGCEYQEGLGLVDLLEGWVAQWMIYGQILVQEVVGRSVAEYRLHDIGAESLDVTLQRKNVHSGVEVDDNGRVVKYRLCDPTNPAQKSELPVEFGLHCYRRRFAQQRVGFPGLASVLDPAGELRDYDDQVTDAARAAADHAVFFVSNHPDAEFVEPDQKILNWRRRVRQYIRPGWDVRTVNASQPAAQYQSFRKEKHTDIGNALEMPWMILRKDASQHNMSSARFDGARYAKAIERLQGRLERRILNFIVRRLVRIAQMEGLLRPTPSSPALEKLRLVFPNVVLPFSWTWPKPPPVDDLKKAMAQRIELENGTLSLTEAIAADGRRSDETLRIRARDNAALIEAGLPPLAGPLPSTIDPQVLAAAISDPADPTPATPATDTATEVTE